MVTKFVGVEDTPIASEEEAKLHLWMFLMDPKTGIVSIDDGQRLFWMSAGWRLLDPRQVEPRKRRHNDAV